MPRPSVLTTCASVCVFFNDTATTEIYTLSLHDALPISSPPPAAQKHGHDATVMAAVIVDRKSTRLNSSHLVISYAVFCLKTKNICTGRIHFDATHSSFSPLARAVVLQ